MKTIITSATGIEKNRINNHLNQVIVLIHLAVKTSGSYYYEHGLMAALH